MSAKARPLTWSARPEGGVVVRVVRAPNRRSFNENVFGGHIEGLSVARSGEVCAWMSLRRDSYGAIVNARSLADDAMPLIAVAGRVLGEVLGETSLSVVPSVAITGAGGVTVGQPEGIGNRSGGSQRAALYPRSPPGASVSAFGPG